MVRAVLVMLVVWEVFVRLDRVPLWYLYHQGGSGSDVYWRMMLYRASVAWLVCLLLARGRWLRLPAVLLAAGAVATDQFYLHYINGDGFTPHEMFLALANPGTVSEALAMYWDLAWPVVAGCFAVVIGSAVAVRRLFVSVPTRVAVAGGLLLIPLGMLMSAEGYGPSGHVVMPIRLPVFMAYYAKNPMLPDREPPYFPPPRGPRVDHVILILDESVMGSHLGVNGYVRSTTPGLAGLIERGDAVTLGVCSSSCNYSVGSLLVMLSGTTVEGMKTDYTQFLRRPSLYAYAARAGYAMHFVNSQDYLTWVACDTEKLGRRLQTVTADRARLHRWQVDHDLLDEIVDFVAARDRTFTIVAKRGIHYPYYDKCPPDRRRFGPCLETPAWSDSFLENVNSFDNGVSWACDEYLRLLHEGLARTGKNVLVIYTSDHGQVLPGEPIEGYTFKRTHAMLDSPSGAVADVPLVLLATGKARGRLAALPRTIVGAASHFDIFPSVLRLLGYDPAVVAQQYGPDLWTPRAAPRKRVFFEGKPVQRCREFVLPDYAKEFRMIREQDAKQRITNDKAACRQAGEE